MVNILEYLPDVFSDYREIKAIADSENFELTILWKEVQNVLDDQFIETATEKGIARREKILKITPFADDDLESRRFRVLARENDKLPYSYRALQNKLNQLCGKNGYILTRDLDAYKITVKLELTQKRMFDEVEKVLEVMTPQTMILSVELRYNQNIDLSKFTHLQLSNYKHRELREEVI